MNWAVQSEEQNLSLKSQCCCGVGVTHTSTASVCGAALAKRVGVKWSPESALFSSFLLWGRPESALFSSFFLWGRPKGMWLS